MQLVTTSFKLPEELLSQFRDLAHRLSYERREDITPSAILRELISGFVSQHRPTHH